MFKRQPKIKSIAMAGSGDYIFTFGLGRDGKVYSWNVTTGKWQIHTQEATGAVNETKPETEKSDAS